MNVKFTVVFDVRRVTHVLFDCKGLDWPETKQDFITQIDNLNNAPCPNIKQSFLDCLCFLRFFYLSFYYCSWIFSAGNKENDYKPSVQTQIECS